MALTGYDKVAGVIGEEMDKAWKSILEKLSQGNVALGSGGTTTIATTELEEFFEKLGGAHMGITFSCVEPKGEMSKFYAHELTPTHAITTMGVEGSISIGIGIKF